MHRVKLKGPKKSNFQMLFNWIMLKYTDLKITPHFGPIIKSREKIEYKTKSQSG